MSDITISSKYAQLIKAGRELFWRHGFKRVSIQEICLKASVSKMTFYRFFENKTELAKAVLDKETEVSLNAFKIILQEHNSSREKIARLISMKQETASGMSSEFLQEFYTSDEFGLKAYIDEKTLLAWNEMLNDFKVAQAAGLFRKSLKPEFFFYFTQKAREMLSDDRLVKLYDSPQELLSEFSNFIAYGISPTGD